MLARPTFLSPPARWTASLPLLMALGCSSPDAGSSSVIQELKSDAPRASAEPGAQQLAARDQSEFGWSFFKRLSDDDENVAFSPHSITTAAAMLSAGASAETLDQLIDALSFSESGEALHKSHNALALALMDRNHPEQEWAAAQILRVSNDFWMQPDLEPSKGFLDTLATYYGAGIHLADFQGATEPSRRAINAKVSRDTEGLIDELLAPGSITGDTVFVLTNALYFKADWLNKFEPTATTPRPFTALSGTSSEVPLMHQTSYFDYVAGEHYQAIALPYRSAELEMVFVVPDAGEFVSVREGLESESVTAMRQEMELRRIQLALPRFQVDSTVPLQAELEARGMVDAFIEGTADFTPIQPGVFISHAIHQATVIVDEEGTEAAAATAFAGSLTSAPIDEPIPLVIDRPFVFFIRDVETGALLFLGQYVQP